MKPFTLLFGVAMASALVSGAAWGLHEKTAHHWPVFEQRFPRADPQVWNPDVSWTNKYKGGKPENGRTRVPVWITDAKHFLASTTQAALFVAGLCAVYGKPRPRWHYAVRLVLVGIAYSVGNNITFDWIY